MKGNLVKKISHNKDFLEYWLYCEEFEYTLSPMAKSGVGHGLRKLSIPNCQAVELGYDLDELANLYGKDDISDDIFFSFKAGFQKCLELLGDKKFSRDDMRMAFFHVQNEPTFDEYIQSVQQTEWDVEIEMEIISDGLDEMAQPQFSKIPKLDADGCLILKRI